MFLHPTRFGLILLAGAVLSCGGDSSGPSGTLSLRIAAGDAGDRQTGTINRPLATQLRVVATSGGAAALGVSVTWSSPTGGGSLNPATSVSNSAGVAITTWTLGPNPGLQTARASADGANGSVSFLAGALDEGEDAAVDVANNFFSSMSTTVVAGTRVTWTWLDGAVQHNILPVSPNTIPSSGLLVDAPFSYSVVFNDPGTYAYYCDNHGTPNSGMHGQIVVLP